MKDIKFLILDVDGTLTDGGIYLSDEGEQFKKFNARDGMGIKKAISKGIEVGIISHSYSSKMIDDRANMLGLKYVYVGGKPKLQVMDQWLSELGLSRNEVAYMGDDINDLEVMKLVGCAACPADSSEEVLEISQKVMKKNGGAGAVREFIDEHLLKN
jgi:YrbI family 3-deoxy-D-manno-octulosonate 8-phosphate phosphatase